MNLLGRTFFQFRAAAALVLLSGCGGGGGGKADGPTADTAARTQGVYEGGEAGTVVSPYTYAFSPCFHLLLLEDGTYYLLTGTGAGGALEVNSLFQGSGTEASATTFASTNAFDFGYEPPPSI